MVRVQASAAKFFFFQFFYIFVSYRVVSCQSDTTRHIWIVYIVRGERRDAKLTNKFTFSRFLAFILVGKA